MPSASAFIAFRVRTRWPRPSGLALAAIAFSAGSIGPALIMARTRLALELPLPSWGPLSTQVAPSLLLAAIGGLAACWQMGQRQRRVDECLRERLDERERIARELHDHLLQGTISLVLRVDASLQALPADHAARRQIESALDYADDVLRRTREQVLLLRGHAPRGELAAALEEAIAQRHPGRGSAAVEVRVVGTPRPLDEACWTELHGIGLEAATNALRHARAARVTLALEYRPDALVLSVRDDGVGIPADILRRGGRPGHCGLRCLRERARMLDARLDLRVPASGGTLVLVRVAGRIAYPGRFRTLQRPSGRLQD